MKTMSDFKKIVQSLSEGYPDNFRGTNLDNLPEYESALARFDEQLTSIIDVMTPAVAILKGMFETSHYDNCVDALKEHFMSQISIPEELDWQDRNVVYQFDGHIQKFVDALLA